MNLLDKQFVLVGGKGGVGKTAVALILGRLASAEGKRTLVCLSNAPSRYLDLLDGFIVGSTSRRVMNKLDVVNLEPRASQEEYGLKVLRNRTVHRIVFGSRTVRAFLDAVPGLAEWAMLGKASFHVLDDDNPYDIVIFDLPATGHGLDVLSLPRAIVSSVPSGRMHEEAAIRRDLLEDPRRCEVLPVTLPEDMSVNEVFEFVTQVRRLGLCVNRIVVNKVNSDKISKNLKKRMETQTSSWAVPTAVAIKRKELETASLKKLADTVPLPQIILPMMPGGSLDERAILHLTKMMEQVLV